MGESDLSESGSGERLEPRGASRTHWLSTDELRTRQLDVKGKTVKEAPQSGVRVARGGGGFARRRLWFTTSSRATNNKVRGRVPIRTGTMSPPSSRTAERVLPLSTALLPLLSHPLVAPLLPRLSALESLLLCSAPSQLLLRLGLSPSLLSLLSFLSLSALLVRVRAQWRLMVALLGAGEAVGRSVSLLDRLDRGSTSTSTTKRDLDETKHLLCWWTLYAAVQLAASYRPSSSPALHLPPAFLRLVRSLRPRPTRSAFPQPSPLPALLPPRTTARLSSQATEALKLGILWTALRTDGLGASTVWDWVLGPVLAVRRARRAGYPKRRVVVIDDDDVRVDDSPPPAGQQDLFSPSSSSSTSGDDRSPTPSPHSQSLSSTHLASPAPPTPAHISYRLTSSSHPIHGRAPRSAFAFETDDSPSPRRAGVYAVEREEQGWSQSQSGAEPDEVDERWT